VITKSVIITSFNLKVILNMELGDHLDSRHTPTHWQTTVPTINTLTISKYDYQAQIPEAETKV